MITIQAANNADFQALITKFQTNIIFYYNDTVALTWTAYAFKWDASGAHVFVWVASVDPMPAIPAGQSWLKLTGPFTVVAGNSTITAA
jgi:hypothetical protein